MEDVLSSPNKSEIIWGSLQHEEKMKKEFTASDLRSNTLSSSNRVINYIIDCMWENSETDLEYLGENSIITVKREEFPNFTLGVAEDNTLYVIYNFTEITPCPCLFETSLGYQDLKCNNNLEDVFISKLNLLLSRVYSFKGIDEYENLFNNLIATPIILEFSS